MEWQRSKAINLALQGGGAHGAFTWGVLDRLLEHDGITIKSVSATSSGAMNAVMLAYRLADGGPEGARATKRLARPREGKTASGRTTRRCSTV